MEKKMKDEIKAIMTNMQVRPDVHVAMDVPLPRNLDDVERRVIAEACRLRDLAIYSWTTRSKNGTPGIVEGPTIKLALMLYRNWGNASIEVKVVKETNEYIDFAADFVDLETGTKFPAIYRQYIGNNRGKMSIERHLDINRQIGKSKVMRNAIITGMPGWLVRDAIEAAKKSDQKKFAKEDKKIPRLLESFAEYGISRDDIEKRIDVPLEEASDEQISKLRGIFRALGEGMTTPGNEFPRTQDVGPNRSLNQGTENKLEEEFVFDEKDMWDNNDTTK